MWGACGAFEWIALGYLGLSSMLITIFAQNLARPARLIATQAGVAALILILCRVESGTAERTHWLYESPSYRFWHFWRHWYPHLFFLFCFEEMGWLVHLVNPGWEDTKLLAFDHRSEERRVGKECRFMW